MRKTVSRIMLTLMLVSTLMLAFNLVWIAAELNTIYVDDDNTSGPWDGSPTYPYQNITCALRHALTGDTIYVYNGTYYESVVVTKSVLLVGEGRDSTIIDGLGESPTVVFVAADNAIISRFTVQNSSQTPGTADAGVRISGVTGCRIIGNHITLNRLGIFVDDSKNNEITENSFTENGQGISLSWSSETTIEANNITGNTYGITLAHSSQNTITDNSITDSHPGGQGIYLTNSFNNTIQENDITDNSHGMWLSNSFNNLVVKNTIKNNTLLGTEIANSVNNTFYHNNFINNPKQVKIGIQNSINVWDSGCEGNYWSDYDGTDLDEDGIGDTPYIIDENNTDRYPLMNRYWNPCDINHDLKVDMIDVSTSAKAFGTEPGDNRWNCHADITGPIRLEPDKKVNMMDIALIGRKFGETYS